MTKFVYLIQKSIEKYIKLCYHIVKEIAMKCIYCGHNESKVLDSRAGDDVIRRRRECLSCGRRFTTYEKADIIPFLIIKKDGSKQSYSFDKLFKSVKWAFHKRGLSDEDIEKLIHTMEKNIQNRFIEQLSSQELADFALAQIKKVDLVAYVRYASAVKNLDFASLKDFINNMQEN